MSPRDDWVMGDIGRQDRYSLSDNDLDTLRRIGPMANPERFATAMAGYAPSQNIIDRRQDPPMGWGEYLYNMMAGEFVKRREYKKSFYPDPPPATPMVRDAGYYDVGFSPRSER
jgi:hypothetical protein